MKIHNEAMQVVSQDYGFSSSFWDAGFWFVSVVSDMMLMLICSRISVGCTLQDVGWLYPAVCGLDIYCMLQCAGWLDPKVCWFHACRIFKPNENCRCQCVYLSPHPCPQSWGWRELGSPPWNINFPITRLVVYGYTASKSFCLMKG